MDFSKTAPTCPVCVYQTMHIAASKRVLSIDLSLLSVFRFVNGHISLENEDEVLPPSGGTLSLKYYHPSGVLALFIMGNAHVSAICHAGQIFHPSHTCALTK